MTTVFLSGSRAVVTLNLEVERRLEGILSQGFPIIVGDADGADAASQRFLRARNYPSVTIYCSGDQFRNNLGSWEVRRIAVPKSARGRAFYAYKDRAMANDADFGFVLWDGKSPGSMANVVELLGHGKKSLVYIEPSNEFFTVGSADGFRNLLSRMAPGDLEAIDRKIGIDRSIARIQQGLQAELTL